MGDKRAPEKNELLNRSERTSVIAIAVNWEPPEKIWFSE
jgi:hypothetical protein